MKPNSEAYNPDPQYLRMLIEKAGISQLEAARLLGIGGNTLRAYLAEGTKTARQAPYTVQFALECLARK